MDNKFSIGQQFKTRGKAPRLCTIVDILKTYNSKGEQVKLRYVATHEFMGRIVTDYDVPETTVAMGLIEKEGERAFDLQPLLSPVAKWFQDHRTRAYLIKA